MLDGNDLQRSPTLLQCNVPTNDRPATTANTDVPLRQRLSIDSNGVLTTRAILQLEHIQLRHTNLRGRIKSIKLCIVKLQTVVVENDRCFK
jgi:hypothetical protein